MPDDDNTTTTAEAPAELVIPPEQDLRDADPEQVAMLRSMMGNSRQMHDFAIAQGWSDDQVHAWMANQGNINYVLPVGLGIAPPQPPLPPPEPPPPPPEDGAQRGDRP